MRLRLRQGRQDYVATKRGVWGACDGHPGRCRKPQSMQVEAVTEACGILCTVADSGETQIKSDQIRSIRSDLVDVAWNGNVHLRWSE